MTPRAMHVLVSLVFVALIAWRLQARIRRLVGRQRLSRRRSAFTLVLFPLLVVLLAIAPHPQPLEGSYLFLGIVLGAVLGLLGLRLTHFELLPEGCFYTPSSHLGVALALLLVGRLVWRFATGALAGPVPAAPGGGLTPLTMLLFGALAGYYCTYTAGLLWWQFRERRIARA